MVTPRKPVEIPTLGTPQLTQYRSHKAGGGDLCLSSGIGKPTAGEINGVTLMMKVLI